MFTAKVSGKLNNAILKTTVALLAVLFLVIPGTGLLSIDPSQASGGGWDDDRDDDHDNHFRRPRYCSQTAEVDMDGNRVELISTTLTPYPPIRYKGGLVFSPCKLSVHNSFDFKSRKEKSRSK